MNSAGVRPKGDHPARKKIDMGAPPRFSGRGSCQDTEGPSAIDGVLDRVREEGVFLNFIKDHQRALFPRNRAASDDFSICVVHTLQIGLI